MNTPNQTYRNVVIAVIVIAVIVIAVIALGKPSTPVAPAAVSETVSTSTSASLMATSTAAASSTDIAIASQSSIPPSAVAPMLTRSAWSYSVSMPKKSYSQNEVIPMKVTITNMTDATTSLNFENGCQLSYTVGSFDLSQHMTCISGGTSIVLGPHGTATGEVDHYPSVYKIPVGTTTMAVSVIGYDTIPLSITITP